MKSTFPDLFSFQKLERVAGKFLRIKNITPGLMRSLPTTLFIMGDNMARYGKGGQAKAMRGQANVIGIPTKWLRSKDRSAYFSNADLNDPRVRVAIDEPFLLVEQKLKEGINVAISSAGIGTGRAELATRAPLILHYINEKIRKLEREYGNR